MAKNNAYIGLHDIFQYRLMTDDQVIEDYGEDYLDDFGQEVPEDLIRRYQLNLAEYRMIQEELRKIRKV